MNGKGNIVKGNSDNLCNGKRGKFYAIYEISPSHNYQYTQST